jgi:hypothetical protein
VFRSVVAFLAIVSTAITLHHLGATLPVAMAGMLIVALLGAAWIAHRSQPRRTTKHVLLCFLVASLALVSTRFGLYVNDLLFNYILPRIFDSSREYQPSERGSLREDPTSQASAR